MDQLPQHGRINCSKCFPSRPVEFDKTIRSEMGWRITANPLAWGNQDCEVVVLGFSKGPTQAGALTSAPHDEIAYKGSRSKVGKILAYIGLLPTGLLSDPGHQVSEAIKDKNGRFHFGSLIRCTVERYDENDGAWKGSGGGMLEKFVATTFGQEVARNCTQMYLGNLPESVKLVVMFGLGAGLNYVQESFKLYQVARKGNWTWLNDIAYTDGKIVVVHVEHFAAQGALIPNWMGDNDHPRSKYGRMAQEAVASAVRTPITGSGVPKVNPAASDTGKPFAPTNPSTKVKTKVVSSGVAPNTINGADIDVILAEVTRAGYSAGKNTKKFAEFRAPSGQTLYVIKTTSKLNNIVLMAHPGFNPESLRKLDGVDAVSRDVKYHSNMSQFPKRLKGGNTETSYGWQVQLTTLEDIPRFLAAFQRVNI